jgi:glyoxylase-like metal-dependent hydrolase (beta-lactamase superfamily II)
VAPQRLVPSLLRWTAPHPDWTPEEGGPEGWDPEVACFAWEAPDRLVVIDPLVPSDPVEEQLLWTELDAIAARFSKPVAIFLTVHWHERSAGHLFDRYGQSVGAEVWAPTGTLEKVGCMVTNPFGAGEGLPGGVAALAAEHGDEVMLWLPGARALVVGDVLLGRDGGLRLCPAGWVGGEENLEQVRRTLLPALELPVEMVLVAHGPPVLSDARTALESALA